MLNFIFGFIMGMMFLAWACAEKAKTHDLTILHGQVKWINRSDREKMTYEELRNKYNA